VHCVEGECSVQRKEGVEKECSLQNSVQNNYRGRALQGGGTQCEADSVCVCRERERQKVFKELWRVE
jgi:hypothetical protein